MCDFFPPKRRGGKTSLLPREVVEVFKARFLEQPGPVEGSLPRGAGNWGSLGSLPTQPTVWNQGACHQWWLTQSKSKSFKSRCNPRLCTNSIWLATKVSSGRISISSSQKLFICWELLISCQCQGMRSLLLTKPSSPCCTRALPEEQKANPERCVGSAQECGVSLWAGQSCLVLAFPGPMLSSCRHTLGDSGLCHLCITSLWQW